MSELVRLVDKYRATHGMPADASIARMMDVAPQTISSWRQRGIRSLPNGKTLKALAQVLDLPYEDYVLQVALYDAGWRDTPPPEPNPLRRSVRQRLKERGLAEHFDAENDDLSGSGSA